ncbi:unnamed protein product [Amoebophrya sp. A25]|nr:unnamed protein product [Amoebophrya sp. A25]|eukprot:GSA25T00000988001.1
MLVLQLPRLAAQGGMLRKPLQASGASVQSRMFFSTSTPSQSSQEYILKFGKHRGLRIDEAPEDYQKWLMKARVYQGKPDMAAALEALGYRPEQFEGEEYPQTSPRGRYGGGYGGSYGGNHRNYGAPRSYNQQQGGYNNNGGYGNYRGNNMRNSYNSGYNNRGPYVPSEKKWESLKVEAEYWTDCRTTKKSERAPDFKHKQDMGLALWLESKNTPDWARTYDWDLHFEKAGCGAADTTESPSPASADNRSTPAPGSTPSSVVDR